MKTFTKFLGFFGGLVIGIVGSAVLLELNGISRAPLTPLVGLACGALGWKIAATAIARE